MGLEDVVLGQGPRHRLISRGAKAAIRRWRIRRHQSRHRPVKAFLEMAGGQNSRRVDDPEGGPPAASSDLGMEGFFKQVNQIEGQIESIGTHLQRLQTANLEAQAVTKATAMKEIRVKMDSDTDEVGKLALKVKMTIEQIDRENATNRQKPGCGMGSGVDRSRMAMTVALKQKVKDRVTEFQNLRIAIQNDYRQMVERRVYTVTGTHPDEDMIDNLIETGSSEQIYQKAIQDHGRAQILDTLAEIQERCDTVKEIEQKLYDLQQMFMDMSVLVEAQGDLLNNIETQVSNAVDHVNAGQVALIKAKKSQRNSRKFMYVAIILVVVILIIAVPPIIKAFRKY